MSPLQAVKKYCVWCCNDQPKEVNLCQDFKCSLNKKNLTKKVLKAIRLRCIDCQPDSKKAVLNCTGNDCFLYIFRLGKNPNRAGIGGLGNIPIKA